VAILRHECTQSPAHPGGHMCVCVGGQRSCRTFRGGNALAIFKSWPTGLFAEEGKSSVSSANSESRMWVWVPSSQELELKLELVVDSEDSKDSKGGWRFNLSYENICTRLAATDVIELKSRPPKVVCVPGQWICFEAAAHDCHSLAGVFQPGSPVPPQHFHISTFPPPAG